MPTMWSRIRANRCELGCLPLKYAMITRSDGSFDTVRKNGTIRDDIGVTLPNRAASTPRGREPKNRFLTQARQLGRVEELCVSQNNFSVGRNAPIQFV